MIEKEYGKYIPTCDGCEETLEPSETFGDAVESMEANGWQRKKIGPDWINTCPVCSKEM